jgi:hypothetical protein
MRRSRRCVFQLASPWNMPLNFSSAVRFGSSSSGCSVAVATTTIRSITPSSRAAFESK